jgi:CBS-domain-containing membrane protein
MRPSVRRAIYAGGLLLVLGATAWVAGLPFLFPSLGPTAYLLAVTPGAPESAPRRVLGGHAIGVLAGLLAYHALAAGLVATTPPSPLSTAGLRLAASAVVSVGLTTGGMLATDLRHAPACATTLIVSLGLLSELVQGGVIVAAVALLLATQAVLDRATTQLTQRLERR